LRSRQIKYDVIAIQETKGRTETIRKTDHNELLIVGAKVDGKNVGGVGFLVNQAVVHLVDSHKIVSPRIAVLRLLTKNQGTISIINGYAPTSAATDEEREEFYQLLEDTFRMREMVAEDIISQRYDDIVKSPSDQREYRGLELTNGLRVLLVSDPYYR
ncbi:hypothetical protein COOONC_27090, partial [Cooperia oncophora]